MGGYAVDPWRSFRRTVGVVLFGWAAAAVTAGASYLALRWVWVPIAVGVPLCLAFAVFLMLLHRAGWIALLSFVPGLFILVGAVQYAPEAALEVRGVRESVVIVADSVDETGGDNHRFTLRTADGEELAERFTYNGSGAPRVGDRFDVLRDPEGVAPMERADEVDAAGRLNGLIGGLVAWTLMAVLAGRRGHVRRRCGKTDSLLLSL
ncbi:hypothetical protein AB0420_30260 [Streptomyces caelestis]|uniref:DUF3592 domain-containing protein n=1 Tax=Streptomyces heliomycini TaxID=284032 RepID=A0ABV5L4H2_9ACTN|nr:hypothetical protein [Streptomyces sp. XY152]KOV32091.1 hypothetical protein ADK58_06470 [Streptomyces sp. XY152]